MPESHHHADAKYVKYSGGVSASVLITRVRALVSADNGGTTNELETIQERYTSCLKTYVEHTFPMQPNRLQDLLHRLPEVRMFSPPPPGLQHSPGR